MSQDTNEQSAPSTREEEAGFETNLRKLESIVSRLEQGDLPLDEALKLYEEGICAYRRCHEKLKSAESRVAKLVETLEGELTEEPFEPPEEEQ